MMATPYFNLVDGVLTHSEALSPSKADSLRTAFSLNVLLPAVLVVPTTLFLGGIEILFALGGMVAFADTLWVSGAIRRKSKKGYQKSLNSAIKGSDAHPQLDSLQDVFRPTLQGEKALELTSSLSGKSKEVALYEADNSKKVAIGSHYVKQKYNARCFSQHSRVADCVAVHPLKDFETIFEVSSDISADYVINSYLIKEDGMTYLEQHLIPSSANLWTQAYEKALFLHDVKLCAEDSINPIYPQKRKPTPMNRIGLFDTALDDVYDDLRSTVNTIRDIFK